MPSYRGLSISLQSQYDARAIPEYPPLSATATPSPRKDDPSSASSTSTSTYSPSSPRTAETYIPIYPGSQLWINYDCPDPENTDTKFWYFKLFVKGRCLLSWGVGSEDSWSGRTAYGIFGGESDDFNGRRMLEKRAFYFPSEDAAEKGAGSFEIKVFRSKGRKRIDTRYQTCEEAVGRGVLDWRNAGKVKKSEPRRMFTYALLDAVDQPYATFKFNCRTVAQLERLGFDLEGTGELYSFPSSPPRRQESPASTNLGCSPPAPAVPKDDMSAARRLSFPPSLHLAPTRSRSEAHSPVKKHSDEAEAEDFSTPHAADGKQPRDHISIAFGKTPMPETDKVQERGPSPPPHTTPDFANKSSSLRGFASRLKRRSNSREEKGIFGVF